MKALFTKPGVSLFLVLVLGAAAYSDTFHVPFIFDDEVQIVQNTAIKDLHEFVFVQGYEYNPRRVVGYFTLALNYALGGYDVTGYHIFNLGVHIANGILVYMLVLTTFGTPVLRSSSLRHFASQIALFAALLFISHPLQTESVTYIVQRFASLATTFYIAAIILYVKMRLSQESGELARAKRITLYLMSLCSIFMAMKTKEIAFTLPVVIILYDLFFFPHRPHRWLSLVPVALSIFIIPLDMLSLKQPVGDILADVGRATFVKSVASRSDYLLSEFSVVLTYIRLLLFPVNQNLLYDYPVFHSFWSLRVIGSFFALLSLFGIAAALYARSRRGGDGALRVVAFGIFWFFITLSVESSFIPITDIIYEHRTYLPSVGIFSSIAVAVAMGLRRCSRRVAIGIVAALSVVIVLFLTGTYRRNAIWRDPETLWLDVITKSPNHAVAHNSYGTFLLSSGRLDEAIEQVEISVGLSPAYGPSHNNLAVMYDKKGWKDQAMNEFRIAAELEPNDPSVHYNLGIAYMYRGLLRPAVDEMKTASRLAPYDPVIRESLAAASRRLSARNPEP